MTGHDGATTVGLLAAVAVEAGLHERSARLYVTLLNATQPPAETTLTATEEYNEY
jgi:NAD(P)H-quinone oxidoreductase subunit 5